jgi:hypothetical protein
MLLHVNEGTAMVEIKRIRCPIDCSEFSRHALDHAIALAQRRCSCGRKGAAL